MLRHAIFMLLLIDILHGIFDHIKMNLSHCKIKI